MRIDHYGYMKWIDLVLPRSICISADPADRVSGAISRVTEVGAGGDSDAIGSQIRRLAGKRVTLTGKLSPSVQFPPWNLAVASVQAVDAAGRAALAGPVPVVREVAAYDVMVRAGRRLKLEAREQGSGVVLKPADEYAPHWMTGGEVEYVNCRKGYRRKLISTTDANGICADDFFECGFNAFPKKPLVIRFRCASESGK